MSARNGEAVPQQPRRQEFAFEETSDLHRFFQECDDLDGPAREPDWEEHLAVIEQYRGRAMGEK